VWLSHHRALATALESIGDRSAAAPLARLLAKPGMSGHAEHDAAALPRGENDRRRIPALREIALARALYRCGDHEGLGARTLESYRKDVRGVFARHASAVLEARR
jgi:hypothetical protein